MEENNQEQTNKAEKIEGAIVVEHVGSVNSGANDVKKEEERVELEDIPQKANLEKSFDSILNVEDVGDNPDNMNISENNDKKAIEDKEIGSLNSKKLDVSSNKLKNIIIVILVIVVIILAWLLQGSYLNNKNSKANNDDAKERVVVSDKKEQGIVRIVERGDSDLGVSNSTLLSDNRVGITAYFGNTQRNKEMTDCSIVFPLDRVIEKKYDVDMVNAMKGLLKPLTQEESSRGYISSLPSGTTLKYIRVNNGIAEVSFGAELNRVGGSCAVTAIRAQIEKTLLQFPQIKSVKICVDGNCVQDMILQP